MLLDVNLPGDTGWDLLRGPALGQAGSPPVVITSAGTVSPKRLMEFRCAGWLPKPFPMETLVDTLDRLINAEGSSDKPMTDLYIVIFMIGVIAALARLRRAGRQGPLMSLLDIVAGALALFGFVYLLWALLRPEDF